MGIINSWQSLRRVGGKKVWLQMGKTRDPYGDGNVPCLYCVGQNPGYTVVLQFHEMFLLEKTDLKVPGISLYFLQLNVNLQFSQNQQAKLIKRKKKEDTHSSRACP